MAQIKASLKTKARKNTAKSSFQSLSKQDRLITLLRRPQGASIDELAHATEWQKHSIRGAISGLLKKKLGMIIESGKVEKRGRVYRTEKAV